MRIVTQPSRVTATKMIVISAPMILAISVPSCVLSHSNGYAMRMPEAGRAQVRGSLSLDEVAAMPGAGDVPDRRETCPPVWDDRCAKRAYFILDRNGVVRYARIQANPLDLLKADDVLQALKDSGAS